MQKSLGKYGRRVDKPALQKQIIVDYCQGRLTTQEARLRLVMAELDPTVVDVLLSAAKDNLTISHE